MGYCSRPFLRWLHCMSSTLLQDKSAKVQSFLYPKNEPSDEHTQEKDVLKFLSTYHSCGLSWANSALKEVLPMTMENPSLMVIQALECLQLYWFGIGNPKKGNLCLGKLCLRSDVPSHINALLDEKAQG